MLPNLKGRLNSEFTLNVDLAPTMLSAAGVEVPPRMQGRDIASLYTAGYAQARSSWRKDFFYEFSWTGANVKPDPSEFLAPIPPVFALVSKAYKVRAFGWIV
jgi:arylsulfatase A-like enzyme